MRRIHFTTVLVPALSWLLVGCGDSPALGPTTPLVTLRSSAAVAPASRTEFDGFINFCQGDFTGFRVTPGGTAHLDVANEHLWVTGNPLIDGIETNTGSGVIDPHGLVVNLDLSLKPTAVNGTWEIRQQFRIPDGTTSGVGHGTGDLRGMTIKFTTDPIIDSPSACNPDMQKAAVHGVILSPAN